MAIPVEVPKLGNTVEECLIAKWRKQPGETVAAGETVAEIETDKATFEVAAPADGTLLARFFDEGALVPVFTNLFVVGQPGESVDAFRPSSAPPAPAARPVASQPAAAPTAEPPSDAHAGPMSPRARRFAEEHGFAGPLPAGSGPGGRILEADVRRQHYSAPRVSAAARQRLAEGAVAAAEGSGVAGMFLSSDVAPPAARISGIREKIARRMRESLATTAQYTLTSSADAAGLLVLRARIKASAGIPDININHLVAFCAILALRDVPALNAWFVDGAVQHHAEIHLGFACDTPRGLMVPVVRDAHRMTAGQLSVRMNDLHAQAVAGRISPDDLSGATFTLSNLGALGIESFTPLLNPPQVAILGVNAIQLKPVRREGRIEFIDSIGLSLTLDHQVIDGAPGARFLQVVRDKIENAETLCAI